MIISVKFYLSEDKSIFLSFSILIFCFVTIYKELHSLGYWYFVDQLLISVAKASMVPAMTVVAAEAAAVTHGAKDTMNNNFFLQLLIVAIFYNVVLFVIVVIL